VGSSLTTSGRPLLDTPITALPFLALPTLYPTSPDHWLVIHSHAHAKIRLCGATAFKMPLGLYFPTCATRFTVLKAITGTGEYETVYLDGQGRVASGRSALHARIKGLLFLALLKRLHHAPYNLKMNYTHTRFHTSNIVSYGSQAVKAPGHHTITRRLT
jgi:hypothetical protein